MKAPISSSAQWACLCRRETWGRQRARRAPCFALTGLALLLEAHPWTLPSRASDSSELPGPESLICACDLRLHEHKPLVRGHWHQVAIKVGDDPHGAGDDEKDDQHAEGQGQNVVGAVGPAAQM